MMITTPLSVKNQRIAQIAAAMRWFWRFSQFYGEYNTLPPQERHRWVEQQAKRQ
ncbi:MAG: hypothetical protein F6J97_14180 [Leptolyngbya sp. SIO4C1]|nr:hypothetical protein [Leptolyngbya sp. SIO4C1]